MKPKDKKILLATDFGEQSLVALEYAQYFAHGTDAGIVLLHVIEENNFFSRLFSNKKEIQKEVEAEAQSQLDKITRNIKDKSKISTHIRYGKVYEQIADLAEEIKPIFIIMGKTEKPSLGKRIIGSNSWHLVEESEFPVLTIRGHRPVNDFENTSKDIILPLDFTKEVNQQITAAIEFAKYFKSAIRLLTIITDDSVSEELKILPMLNKAKDIIEEAGVECTSELKEEQKKPIHQVITEFAQAHTAHLIVIMTQQKSDFIEYFVGSNALEILNKSEIPVLSVKPWEATKHNVFSSFVDPLGIF